MLGEYPIKIKGKEIGRLTVTQEGLKTRFRADCRYRSSDVLRLAVISENRYVMLGVMMPEGERLTFSKSYSRNELAAMGLSEIAGADLLLAEDGIVQPAARPQAVEPAWQEEAIIPEPELLSEPDISALDLLQEPDWIPEEDWIPEQESVMAAATETEVMSGSVVEPAVLEAFGQWERIDNLGLIFQDEILAESCKNVRGALRMETEDGILLAIPAERDEPFPLMPIFCFGMWDQINGKNYIIFKIKDGYIVE